MPSRRNGAMAEKDCFFCKIIQREMESSVVYDDDLAFAFRDINPQAPVHILVVPRRHIASMIEVGSDDLALLGHLLGVARKLADDEQLGKNGYRIVINT